MAIIIYGPRLVGSNSRTFETLRARAYADGIDIHEGSVTVGTPAVFTPPHELRGCTNFQWQFNNRIDGWVDLTTSPDNTRSDTDEWIIDERSVANSGDYRCRITVGEGEDVRCRFNTPVVTVAIIDCIDTQPVFFLGTGGNGNKTVDFEYPHFIGVVVTRPEWLIQQSVNTTQTGPVVRSELTLHSAIYNFLTVADEDDPNIDPNRLDNDGNPIDNAFRNGYVDLIIGDFLCAYPVQQDYERPNAMLPPIAIPPIVQPDDVPEDEADPPLGPTIQLLQLNDSVPAGTYATAIAVARVVLPDGTNEDHVPGDFVWTVTGDTLAAVTPIESYDEDQDTSTITAAYDTAYVPDNIIANPTTERTLTFSITVNGVTVSESITLTVVADVPGAPDSIANDNGVVTGELSGMIAAKTPPAMLGDDATIAPVMSGRLGFRVEQGLGKIVFNFVDRGFDFFARFPYYGPARLRFRIIGPGIVDGDFEATVMMDFGTQDQGLRTDVDFIPAVANVYMLDANEETITQAEGTTVSVMPDPRTYALHEMDGVRTGFLTPGTYVVILDIEDPGSTTDPATGITRLDNLVFAPVMSYNVIPIDNFVNNDGSALMNGIDFSGLQGLDLSAFG